MMEEADTGGIVRFHRQKAGLTRSELATLAGVGKTVVFDIENNKQSVKCSTLKKMLRVLNIRIAFESQLMSEYEKQKHEKS
jgi:transcriptional regulator with XRE-family HTH domain